MNSAYNKSTRLFVLTVFLAVSNVMAHAGVVVKGNVYGGGNLADVKVNTEVIMSTGTVEGNVFGGGKGKADNFTCDKAMVGVVDEGVTKTGEDPNATYTLLDGGTTVNISGGTVEGDVYGGGEIGRVERNTIVTIGEAGNTTLTPIVKGHVFGAGKGVETHGYSALVRGNATVTIQGKAEVWQDVHGGGEKSSVGRYYVASSQSEADTYHVRIGMPCYLKAGGKCIVNIQDQATVGSDDIDDSGDVFGAGQGVTPSYNNEGGDEDRSKRMVYYTSSDAHPDNKIDTEWNYYVDEDGNEDRTYVWEYFTTNADYLLYVETLGRASETDVVIGGKRVDAGTITASTNAPTVKGTVYGGSESGFVYHSTEVNIEKGTINGDVFGGGKGLPAYAEAGRVRRNTNLTISNGTILGNVYGGGSLGDVGTIDKTDQTNHNYTWTQNDGSTDNVAEHNTNATATNTGICKVTIEGGTIGVANPADATKQGNVFGAGRGSSITWWCEKAIAYSTSVTVSGGTVNGTVYGGGEVGRVEDDAKVVIGVENATGDAAPTITGDVFGAGAGLATHGYSALVRGNAAVTVQGTAQVGGSVYGGGETASVGKFNVVGGLPTTPLTGGNCTVEVKDNAKIGNNGTGHNVYGACKGVTPAYNNTVGDANRSKSLQLRTNAPSDNSLWSNYDDDENSPFIWRYYASKKDYEAFLRTLALTSHPTVTIAESASVYGSVYGGGERGLTLGNVDVNITGGTVEQDVYGGGALADTNAGNADASTYVEKEGLIAGESPVSGLYTESGGVYTLISGADETAQEGEKYYTTVERSSIYTTSVDLTGGLVKGDAYGGGLGQKDGFNSASEDIEAVVYGDIAVTLDGTAFVITNYEDAGYTDVVKSGRVFGCNNLYGSPQGDVTVTVMKTVSLDAERAIKAKPTKETGSYELAAVYGGGNLAPFETAGKKAHVIIHGCDDTSIQTVYGGGNAAAVPEAAVDVYSCYEIASLFGGGNGSDKYKSDAGWQTNPGADVHGNANTMIYGGTVHEAFGGSNDKGTIHGNVTIDVGENVGSETCTLDVGKLVGAGKNADVNGDLKIVMGCKPEVKVPLVFGGADNANVNGDVELTITSGNWGKVVGGNNNGGVIRGHIILNIEETSCIPINIDELYGCGYNALYSEYGYYIETEQTTGENATGVGAPTETAILTSAGKLHFLPRLSANDPHLPVKSYALNENVWEWTVYTGADGDVFEPYASPEVNIVSCTHIGQVFGGGYGATATVYGNPTVNINMIPGAHAAEITRGEVTNDANALGEIGDVFGGGNQAAVWGSTTVNIATETAVKLHESISREGVYTMSKDKTVTGAYITGNVYGGGNLANVGDYHTVTEGTTTTDVIDNQGHTFVNICAARGAEIMEEGQGTGRYEYTAVNLAEGATGVTIGGDVFGGGRGEALESGDGAFRCGKAMVTGSTHVAIGNGTVSGTVFGGGMVGRVEENTVVTVGMDDEASATSAPVITKDVFGAGKGVSTHGYAALVRGHAYVNVGGHAKVMQSVYGGGEIASVGRYNVGADGMPYSLKNQGSGYCHVTVGGYAEIGPDNMRMQKDDGDPDDTGYIFGAGKGILPYEGYASNETPWRIQPDNSKDNFTADKEDAYLKYIESLALATQTYVTVGGHAFVKGSVYGGSENGHVLHDTDVKIQDNCQIGNGDGMNRRYTEAEFIDPTTTTVTTENALAECASWPYGKTVDANNDGEPDVDATGNIIKRYLPYDKYDSADGDDHASDGHTFYGNVFGGGSGLYPYKKPGSGYKWLRSAGRVYGNTSVEITGGHILTSVYGGCELTDVGDGRSLEEGKGTCKVKMSGGTLGVPRTLEQIAAHPVTCYLFGAGKGDQRTRFNQWTNVGNVIVEINDSISRPIIYGSVFGGGEDGHVLGNVHMNIKTMHDGNDPVIGTWGTSYVEGNVFGGGRGFGGDALTAGVVCGNVNINIQGGKMLGSIYGGGRLGSVGTYLVPPTLTDGKTTHPNYGQLIPDGKKVTIDEANGTVTTEDADGVTHGLVTINVSGGSIGNDREYKYYTFSVDTEGKTDGQIDEARNAALSALKTGDNIPNTDFEPLDSVQEGNTRTYHYWLKHTKGGNIFAGSMGRFYGLDNRTVLPHWPHLGKVKSTKLTITGGTVKSCVYGGGELGWTEGTHSAIIGDEGKKDVSTEISISGGTIGTEVAEAVTTGTGSEATTSNIVRFTFGSVFGGGYGSSLEKLVDANGKETNPKFQAGRVKYSTKVDISGGTVWASVYGGGEVASVGYGFQSYHTDNVIGEAELTSADKAANTYVSISGDAVIGKAKDETNNIYYGGATMGNVYGGGSGNRTIVRCGLILGNTNVNVSGGTIYHNIYGGGAYGSVGNFIYTTATDPVHQTKKVYGVESLHTPGTGTAKVTITGGTIGIDGRENGMVFGSSRGDVIGNLQRDDYMAWVNEANVTIGTSGDTSDGPQIRGSVYGSGENGHTLHNTNVAIHSGTIGILTGSTITGSSGKEYNGAEYPYRGNVYGGGCGTDTYTEGGNTLYNPLAGLVKGNATVTMDGGRVARTIYGGGAMGSVGTFSYADTKYNSEHTDVPVGKPYSCTEGTGLCTVTISGGSVGPDVLAMPNSYGNVFGAGRGEVHDPTEYTNLETSGYVNKTLVTVSGSAFVRGSVYGGAESGHVLADTHVKIQGGQIGCGKNVTKPYGDNVWADTPTDATDLECASWPYKAPYTPYDKFADEDGMYPDYPGGASSADNAHPTGTDGHTFYGNVFGGGSGYEPYAPGKWLPTAGWVEGNTTVEITGGHILTSVYGGNEMSDVGQGGVRKMTDLAKETPDMFYDITKPGGKCTVKMSGGTLGVPRTLAQIAAHPVTCYLFGAGKGDQRIFFNKTTNVKEVEVEISGTARIYGSVFGGGEDGHVMRDVKMTIKDNAKIGTWGTSYVEGNVFGGGRGFSGEALTAGNVGGCVTIDIQGGTMLGSVYGGGRLGSVGHGLYLVDEKLTIAGEEVKPYGILRPDNQDDRGRTVAGFKRGNITINISGGTIGNDIEYAYIAPDADAAAVTAAKVNMPNTQFDYQNRVLYTKGGNVFAGCMGRLYALDGKLLTLWPELGRCKNTVLNITGGHIKSNVYGGAELGVVQENTKVSITGGIIGTTVGDNAYIYGSAFGGGKGSNEAITYPEGTSEANKVPISEAGTVHGNVEVELNKGVATSDNKKGGIVNKIFGCNDTNGTPKGTVTVHVYATQTPDKDNVSTKQDKGEGKYDVEAVYGGGNMAAYDPVKAMGTDAEKAQAYTNVIIDGCELTSIGQVYGGGNAASAPATDVTVNGTYEIGQAFGGGNGMDKLPTGAENPGANVGYLAYADDSEKAAAAYGSGKAHVTIYGGTVHAVYGGSNSKGNIRVEARATLEDAEQCSFDVGEAYGGGRNAEMDGDAVLEIGCISGLGKAYGGAADADINGDVTLNITNGTYGQVFGGNDAGGKIGGTITVNIEETGCRPIIIGELYGGGNEAAYSVEDINKSRTDLDFSDPTASNYYKNYPRLNVHSFTSIGKVFGGGYGAPAAIVGNPQVNISVYEGKYYNNDDTDSNGKKTSKNSVIEENARVVGSKVAYSADDAAGYADGFPIPSHAKGKIGAINTVFGGGNAAKVTGDPTVNIGTEAGDEVYAVVDVATVADVKGLYTRTGEGTTLSPYTYTEITTTTAPASGTTYYLKTTKAVDIRGNIFGGGNNAEVDGNTNVVVGKKKE